MDGDAAAPVLNGTDPTMGGGMPPQQMPDVSQMQPQQPQGLDPNTDPELQAAAVHHGRLADALNAIGNLLGGRTTTHLQKNADGSISITHDPATTGEKWARVAQAAVTGAARGFAVGQGPGGPQRAAAAGIMGGMAQSKQQEDQTQALADKYNNQNRQDLLFKANMIKMNQDAVERTFNMQRAGIQAAEGEEDRQAQREALMNSLGAKHAHFANMEEASQIYNSSPEWQQAHHDARTPMFTNHDSKGNVTGVDAYLVPEDQMAKPYPKDYQSVIMAPDPKNPNGPLIEQKGAFYPAGSNRTDKMLALIQNDSAATSKNANDLGTRQINKEKADKTALPSYQLDEDTHGNSVWVNPKDPSAPPIPAQGVAKFGTADKKTAAQEKADTALEKQYGSARDAVNLGTDYLDRGVFTGPSDELLQEKFFELAKPSSGFRMTTPQMQMLADSRSWMQSAEGKAYHAKNGTWFSDQQRQQIVGAMLSAARSHEAMVVDPSGHVHLRPAPQAGAGGAGDTGIPQPVAPVRPDARVPATFNGKQGSVDTFGNFYDTTGRQAGALPGSHADIGTKGALPPEARASAKTLGVVEDKNGNYQQLIGNQWAPVIWDGKQWQQARQ
jgi:hypothetical protein